MTRFLPLLVAACLVAGAGVVHGLRTDRWSAKADLAAAAGRLDDVPMTVGEWEGRPVDIDARQLALAEAAGHLSRVYGNRRTGAEVNVVVLCGRPGPIALHSPEVCYAGSGFSLSGERATASVTAEGVPEAQLFQGRFVKPGVTPETLDVYWSWRSDGPWGAPSEPRLTFLRSSILYKLYVIRRLAAPDGGSAQQPCLEFLQDFLPELQKQMPPA